VLLSTSGTTGDPKLVRLSRTNIDAVGRPVPGGEIVLLDDAGGEITGSNKVGELVYRGPNVMLGYAENRQDLANPRVITGLRTGDLAVRKPNGYFKIVGRLKRFIKLYGLRVNLDDVEVFLSASGNRFYCSGTDDLLVVFHVEAVDEAGVLSALASKYNIRESQIELRRLPEMPLMSSGKVDYARLKKDSESIQVGKHAAASSVKAAFCEFLDQSDISDSDTFVSVGGDSLSYLNMSLFLEKMLALSAAVALGFWNLPVEPNDARIYLIIGSVAALLWMENITLPRRVGYLIMWIASLSYYMYIVHILPGFLAQYIPHRDSVAAVVAIWFTVMFTSIMMAYAIGQVIPVIESWLRASKRAVFR